MKFNEETVEHIRIHSLECFRLSQKYKITTDRAAKVIYLKYHRMSNNKKFIQTKLF